MTVLVSRLRQLATILAAANVAPGWYLFYFLIGLSAGRALLSDLAPLTVPLVVTTAVLPSHLFWPALAGVFLGVGSRPPSAFSGGLIGDLLVAGTAALLARRGRARLRESRISAALVAGGTNLAVKYGCFLLNGPKPGFLPGLIAESVLAGLIVIPIHYLLNNYRREKRLSFYLLIVCVILGLGDLRVGPALIGDVLGRGVLLLVAGTFGAGWGAASGVVIGLLSGNFWSLLQRTGFYAATGFFAGLFKNCGRACVIGGFLLSTLLFAAFYGQQEGLVGHFWESILAVGLYLIAGRFQSILGEGKEAPPARPLHAQVGFAQRPRFSETLCGDSLGVAHLESRRLLMTLSDGMGAGINAARESRIVVKLMEQLLSYDLEPGAAAAIVNTALYLRGGEESAATIDLALADLDACCLKFLKAGAPPSYLKRGDQMEIIRSVCWPAGILEDVDPEVLERRILPGDILIMATDGVTEAGGHEGAGGDWLYNYLRGLVLEDPQVIADLVLKHALKAAGYQNRDDMSVLVARYCVEVE